MYEVQFGNQPLHPPVFRQWAPPFQDSFEDPYKSDASRICPNIVKGS